MRKKTSKTASTAAPTSRSFQTIGVKLPADIVESIKKLTPKRSVNSIIRDAISQYIAKNFVELPSSIGIVNGVYSASYLDDVTELANTLRSIEHNLVKYAIRNSNSEELHEAQLQILDANNKLIKISGALTEAHIKRTKNI